MLIFSCPASYLPTIEADVRRCIRDLDRLTDEQKAIFLAKGDARALVLLGTLPEDASASVFAEHAA